MGEIKNIKSKLTDNGNSLLLKIDLTKDFGATSTGKTNTVASSGGFVAITEGSDIIYSLNVNKKLKKK